MASSPTAKSFNRVSRRKGAQPVAFSLTLKPGVSFSILTLPLIEVVSNGTAFVCSSLTGGLLKIRRASAHWRVVFTAAYAVEKHQRHSSRNL